MLRVSGARRSAKGGRQKKGKKKHFAEQNMSFAEQFARQLQLVVPMTVDFYVLGVWT